MSDGKMTYEDWLRGCVHHDGRHGYVTLPCDEVLKIADFIEKLRADCKTEPQIDCEECKYVWWNSEAKRYECQIEKCPYSHKPENSSEKPNNLERSSE